MNDILIVNTPVAAPPKPAAQPSSAHKPGTDRGETTDFATELDRQLSTAEGVSPGPGRDAGKGRETGESAPESDKTEQQPVEGQSRVSGREAEADRLALMSQLLAATTAATASAGQVEASVATTGTAGSGDVATAVTAPAAAQTAAAQTAAVGDGLPATVEQTSTAVAAGQAVAAASESDSSGTQTVPETSAAVSSVPIPVESGDLPAGAANGTADRAIPAEPPADAVAATGGGSESTAAATTATMHDGATMEIRTNTTTVRATTTRNLRHATVSDRTAAGNQPAAAAGTTAVGDATEARLTDSQPVPAGSRVEAKAAIPAAKETASPAAARVETDQGLAGSELARLTGSQPGTASLTNVVTGDKAILPEPVTISVIDQLVAGAKMLRQGPVTEMRLQLKPEFLGRVDLKVTMADGILSARIIVDNPQVKAAIEASLPQLKQDLAQQGIALQGMTVGLGGGRGQEAGDSRQSSFQRFAPQYQTERSRALSDVTSAAQRAVSSNHRVDLVL